MKLLLLDAHSPKWEEVLKLGAQYDEDFVPCISARMPLEDYFGRFRQAEGFGIIAIDEETVVGFLGGFYRHPENGSAWYQYIVIEKEHRHKGLAGQLYAFGDDLLRSQSITFVFIRTWSGNRQSERSFYKHGFLLKDIIRNDRGIGIHTLLYEKSLFRSVHFKGIRRLGIVGGMGSAASAQFVAEIAKLTSQIGDEQSQLPFVLINAPDLPDRTAQLANGGSIFLRQEFSRHARDLELLGCSHIVYCCFTADNVIDGAITGDVPIVSLSRYADEVLTGKIQSYYLVLCTNGSYANRIMKADTVIWPSAVHQQIVHNCIYHIKAGRPAVSVLSQLVTVVNSYRCDGVILACTDLSLISLQLAHEFPDKDVVDVLNIMSHDVVNSWNAQLKLGL